jgi:hypothetical protein
MPYVAPPTRDNGEHERVHSAVKEIDIVSSTFQMAAQVKP